jgi:hypothetical protein
MEFSMKATVCAVVCSLLFMTGLVSAQASLQGSWTGEMTVGGAAQQVFMNISVDGERVSGSVVTPGIELSIQDAHLTGNVVEFTTIVRQGETDAKFLWTGTIGETEIAFTSIDEAKTGPANEFIVHRAEP